MRSVRRILLATCAAALAALGAPAARAQLDITKPIPNVMLLVDTSGSMEHMIDGRTPEDAGATCNPGTTTPLNRWATLVSVLTGTINNFSCFGQSRSSNNFVNEFKIGSVDPYDRGYYLPFHRILSNGCTPGPGALSSLLPGNPCWSPLGIRYHPHNDAGLLATCSQPFSQLNDGILDVFSDRVRFGMMTFDTMPDQRTGGTTGLDTAGGVAGMWSYWANWNGGNAGGHTTGQLPACTPVPFEVGARNQLAPQWEGRLMPFLQYDAPLNLVIQQNEYIQEAIKAMRPYGATPLGGMLQDAYDYLIDENTTDVCVAALPNLDAFVNAGCRKRYIIVLSDGEPNMDMRPECESINGCPYDQPWEIARTLNTLSPAAKRVQTYVIGFGLSAGTGFDCKNLTQSDLTSATGICSTATGPLKACCNLGRIAYEGGTGNALYADDLATLKSALSTVLSQVSIGSTSRTYPVFASANAVNAASQGNAPAASYQFVTSFFASPSDLWKGNLERKRYQCKTISGSLVAELQDIDATKGDDFGANVNSGTGADRSFISVVHDDFTDPSDSQPVDPNSDDGKETLHSRFSIRPKLASNDGWGLLSGTATNGINGGAPTSASDVIGKLDDKPEALGMNPMPAGCTSPTLGPSTNAAECVQRLMAWELGEPTAPTLPTRVGNEFGAIYHSTPTVVGTPREFLRDESYSSFAIAQAERPTMLYTGTTDGQMHAFKVGSNKANETGLKVDTKQNNELWSFLPPYVLPGILSQYDRTQQFLLDGPVVLKDVVFNRDKASATAGTANWRTVLVGGGGKGGGYYYALDVTNPEQPIFLWQLSTDTYGRPLFGHTSSTPAVATISLREGSALNEVAVAILPGGFSSQPLASCPTGLTTARHTSGFSWITGPYSVRSNVRCWKKGAARSLTIVRLDTGKILMNLRGEPDDGPQTGLSNGTHYKSGFFDSPVSGVPVPYPSQPGQVAKRVYVGDADGTLWRIDLSDPVPTNWTARIAWDSYSLTGDTAAMGQPIQTPPVVTVDGVGNPVVLFSTGDQEMFTSSTAIDTRVWSITEKPVLTNFTVNANWYIPFTDGKRVTGPISLFNSVAYFATFTPQTGSGPCSDGYGSVWGVDYLLFDSTAGGPRPKPRYVPDPIAAPTVVVSEQSQGNSVVVFGVAVTQTPTCSTETTFADPYLGQHTAVSSVTAGEFQLVFQTGQGGATANKSVTNTTTQVLPRPRETTRIDSWASIVE